MNPKNADLCARLETVTSHDTTRTKSPQKSKINFGRIENSAIQPNRKTTLYAKPPHRKQIRCGGSVLIQFKTARSHDFSGVPVCQKLCGLGIIYFDCFLVVIVTAGSFYAVIFVYFLPFSVYSERRYVAPILRVTFLSGPC